MNDSHGSKKFWQDQYEAGTTGWDRGEVHPAMVDWMASGELSPCRIVIPGCGRGHEVIHLSQAGFDVTAIDYAVTPIECLQSKLESQSLSATVAHCDLFSFAPPEPFDAVYEQTCLCAIQPQERARYADRLFDWLRPGGKLFLLMMQTGTDTGPPFHCAPDTIKHLFADSRWKWDDAELRRYLHPSGPLYELATVLTRRDLGPTAL